MSPKLIQLHYPSKYRPHYCPAAKKPAGRKLRPTKTVPEDIPSEYTQAKGMVIHRVPCLRPMAKITKKVGEGLRGGHQAWKPGAFGRALASYRSL